MKKAILADSNQEEAKLIFNTFIKQSIDIELIHCSLEAQFFQSLKNHSPDEVCYLLIDVNISPQLGVDVLNTLSNHTSWQQIPVILFLDTIEQKNIVRYYEAGANAIVQKPSEPEKLTNTILAIHHFWKEINLTPYGSRIW